MLVYHATLIRNGEKKKVLVAQYDCEGEEKFAKAVEGADSDLLPEFLNIQLKPFGLTDEDIFHYLPYEEYNVHVMRARHPEVEIEVTYHGRPSENDDLVIGGEYGK